MDDDLPSKFQPDVADPVATLTLAPLKSVQPYRTQDEFLVAMKEDLAEWLNNIYDLELDENSLFAYLATGALLCRHANAFNAAAATQDPVPTTSRRNSGIAPLTSGLNPPTSASTSSTSGACPSTSGPIASASASSVSAPHSSAVPFRESAQPGSFQSRDNIANFLAWCRQCLRLRDTLLFETEDLVKGRNGRNVVLCLLEVARRGARIGMPAPSIVRLEAEIDAEIARDEAAAAARLLGSGGIHGNDGLYSNDGILGNDGIHGNDGNLGDGIHGDGLNGDGLHGNVFEGRTRDAGVQTMDEYLTGAASPPPGGSRALMHRSSLESISSSSGDSSSVRGGGGGGHSHHPHQPPHHQHQHHSTAQQPAAATVGRQRRPVIAVDMMSLDEMVRNILNKCTCEFQYPMVRVSEGKYKIGDSLTLIFVRILRNHVMVRIGGGWDTLENYLHRHDPCRMETKVTKTGSSHVRTDAHACGAVSGGEAGVGGIGVGGKGVEGAREGWKDGSAPCNTSSKARNDGGGFEENLALETSVGYNKQSDLRPDDPVINDVPLLSSQSVALRSGSDSIHHSLQAETSDYASDEADRSTGTTLRDGRTRDVACQTDDPTRRYSSSSGASSWESAGRDERNGRVGMTSGRIDVTLDEAAQRDHENNNCRPASIIEDSDGSSADPLCIPQDHAPDKDKDSGKGSTRKPGPSELGCPQCGQSALPGKQTVGLCRQCRNRRGQLRPASAKATRQLPQCPSATSQPPGPTVTTPQDKRLRAQRPASAQEKHRHPPGLDAEAQLGGTPRGVTVPTGQRPSSAQGQRQQRGVGSASTQKLRRRTLGPSAIQEHVTSILGPSSSASIKTLVADLAQDPQLDQQRPRQRTQRPASAQENRRLSKRSRAEEESLALLESSPGSAPRRGESTTPRGFSAGFSRRPSPLASPAKTTTVAKTKSQEDLTTKSRADTQRTSPGRATPAHQKPSSRSTISSPGDRQLIREVFSRKKLDVGGCGYDIPELVEVPNDDFLPLSSAQDGSGRTRPRKEVGRSGSFTSKIPKPAAMN